MASFNKVILMGNLTRDPEMRFTQNDMAICNLSLAVNRRFKDGQGEWKEEATFVDVTIFGKRGEAFAKHHSKGKPAFIEGSLRLDNWKDKESGANRSKLYVVGDNWEFVGGGSGGGGGGGEYASSNASSNASSSAGGQGGGQNLEVDDTPF
jgi:single-strand DNA-binding protein